MRVSLDISEQPQQIVIERVDCRSRHDVQRVVEKLQQTADFLWPPNKEPGLFDDGNGIVEAEAAWGRNQRDKSWAERSGLK